VADMDLDGSDLIKLAAEIRADAHKVAEGAYPLVKEYAQKLRDDWRDNARQSAGRHGHLYPRAITMEQLALRAEISWEVGPDSAQPQGGMGRGFEYGSVNQPPHLDMARAVIDLEPQFNTAVEALARSFLK
jgi:hypothetical protein